MPVGRSARPCRWAAEAAIGTAFIAGVLADLAVLKQAMLDQAQVNANVEQWAKDLVAAAQSIRTALDVLSEVTEKQNRLVETVDALAARVAALEAVSAPRH